MNPPRQLLAFLLVLLVSGLFAQQPERIPAEEDHAPRSYGLAGELHGPFPGVVRGFPCDPGMDGTLSRLVRLNGKLVCIRSIILPDDLPGHLPGFSRMEGVGEEEPDPGLRHARRAAIGSELATLQPQESPAAMTSILEYRAPDLKMSNLRIEETRNEVVKKLKMDQWDFSGLLQDMVSHSYIGW